MRKKPEKPGQQFLQHRFTIKEKNEHTKVLTHGKQKLTKQTIPPYLLNGMQQNTEEHNFTKTIFFNFLSV